MWVTGKTFESLIHDRSVAQGQAAVLERELVAIRTTMEWMTTRVNQLEHERAVLILQFMGVKIEVPTIESYTPPTSTSEQLNQIPPSFMDMGDDEAARLGIGWDESGELTYSNRK